MMDFITPTPTNINVLYARQTSFVSHHSALFSQQLPHSNQSTCKNPTGFPIGGCSSSELNGYDCTSLGNNITILYLSDF